VSLGSWQVDRYVVMRNSFIPPVQGPAGSVFNDGLLIVLAGEAADGVNADEKRDRGKHDLAFQRPGLAVRTFVPRTGSELVGTTRS